MESKENNITPEISDDIDTHRAISTRPAEIQISLSTDAALNIATKQTQPTYNVFFLIAIIKPYFDVSEFEIKRRVKACLVPKSVQLDFINQKPDLYGPFWIITTLAVTFSLFGNIARYLANFHSDIPFKIDLIHKALVIFYAYLFGVPMVLSAVGKGLNFAINPIQAISLYGYSLSSSIIASVVCILPSNILQWLLLGYCFVTSSFHLMNTISKLITNIEDPIKYSILGALCASQISLFVIIKVVLLNLSR